MHEPLPGPAWHARAGQGGQQQNQKGGRGEEAPAGSYQVDRCRQNCHPPTHARTHTHMAAEVVYDFELGRPVYTYQLASASRDASNALLRFEIKHLPLSTA